MNMHLSQRMAHELGNPDREYRFRNWVDRIHTVYNERLLVTDKKAYPYAFYTSRDDPLHHDRNMVAQAFALQFDLVPASCVSDVQTAFLSACASVKNLIAAGEIGLKYLFNTLSDLNRPDIILEMCRQEEHPSYMRFIRRGESTLNEFWQDIGRSKCHDILGTIYEWFYEGVLGAKAETEAYRTWRVRPPLDSEFSMVGGTVDCPYGTIEVKYERRIVNDKEETRMWVTVPPSTTEYLLLPSDACRVPVKRLGKGGYDVERNVKRILLEPEKYELLL